MGRHKQHKPRRSRGENDRPATEWFGTAFHSTAGMQHLDVRRSGNGVLITSSPAEIDGVPASWPLRLRNDVDGGLNEVGAALAAGRGHVFGVTEGPGQRTALAFLPDHPEEGVGTLARVRTSEDPDGDVVFERSAERPMGLWAEAGESLLRIVPLLGPDAPPADELEDCRLCPGCYRPVYESSSSHTLIGAGPLPLMGLCRLCAEGSTLRSLRQANVPIDTRQRTVLETVAAALA
ncbi:hypothetical protein [Streptomyces coelicolor A3(2)]|jgi:hypothetical protein|uniref:Uncharacterized protein n=3 Tax=Streptomyces TaxID=1883 RepID=Q9ACW8_STRCO|nr:hypothetical protein [Streptomyces coelicolor]CAC36705.1 hypothetical protein [Streptomyces coelicolor A3(2)]